MRQWRVGTLSMGLLLLSAGVGLLLAQFDGQKAFNLAMRWWPLILIILGIEVLIYTWSRKNEEGRVKYDLFSIIMVVFLIFTALGLKLVQDVGLAQYITKQLQLTEFNPRLGDKSIAVDSSVQKVVIDTGQMINLELRISDVPAISMSGEAWVKANNLEEARQAAEQEFRAESRQEGSTQYVNLGSKSQVKCQVLIPSRVALEVNGNPHRFSLIMEEIKNDCLIRTSENPIIILPAQADVLLTVMGLSSQEIDSNLSWVALKKAAGGETPSGAVSSGRVESPGRTGENTRGQNINETIPAHLQAQLGNGSHKLTLISKGGMVKINQLP